MKQMQGRVDRLLIAAGAALAGLSVAIGAFAAHGLKDELSAYALAIVETGARYQMYHALAAILAGLLVSKVNALPARLAGWAFVLGSLIFAGSLYILAITDIKWLGAITPIGGTLYILGWGLLVYAALKDTRTRE